MPTALLRLRSDEQLVAAFRAGSDEAFNVIHDRYRQRLFAYTRQMLGGSRSDAEDALQDVFLRAYNALRVDGRPLALKAWLYRVAHNRCVDHLRRPVPAPADIFDAGRSPMPDPLAEAERRDDLRRLVADVRRLPEQQRSALLMRELEGLSYAELADALDVTVPAVKSLLVRARMGLVEAAEARDTACSEIRTDLTLSFGRGVRASAKARRHMRECSGCQEYRSNLRGVRTQLGALTPVGHTPLGFLAKVIGLGGGSAATGGGVVAVGGGAAVTTTAKVAAIVCCAAITAGGAKEIQSRTGSSSTAGVAPAKTKAVSVPRHDTAAKPDPRPIAIQPERSAGAGARARSASVAAAAAPTVAERRAAAKRRAAIAAEEPMSPHAVDEAPTVPPAAVGATDGAGAPTGGTTAGPTASTHTTPASPTVVAGTQPQSGPAATTSTDGGSSSSSPGSSGGSSSSGASSSGSSPTATVATTP